MALTIDRRQELAQFLRNRRARLQPEDVGVPRGRRRRTPGLRREEVAGLANVSTEWYKWLEQARDVRASPDTLRQIARALRLQPSETQHLLRLSGYGLDDTDTAAAECACISDNLQLFIDQLEDCPTWIFGRRWDVLAWNRAAKVVYGDIEVTVGRARNGMYQLFLGELRHTLIDWEHHARGLVGAFRVEFTDALEDPWYHELVDYLLAHSPEFAGLWADHDINGYRDGEKHYNHPTLGHLAFAYTALDVADERFPHLSITSYVPLDGTDTRAKVRRYLRG